MIIFKGEAFANDGVSSLGMGKTRFKFSTRRIGRGWGAGIVPVSLMIFRARLHVVIITATSRCYFYSREILGVGHYNFSDSLHLS